MKKILLVLVILFLVAGSAHAELKLWYQMDSADDFNLGENVGGFAGRTYVTNSANGNLASGMTSSGGVIFDASEGALNMTTDSSRRIQGMEDASAIFTSSTQYTFSLWAKADMTQVTGNGYSFYVKDSAGLKYKCDLSFKPANAAGFTAPGGGWQNSAYHIWDTDPAYADRYVDPETWNMYTFTWDAENNSIATYVNGVLRGGPYSGPGGDVPDFDPSTITEWGFGCSEWGSNLPGGWYKDFAVWDNALDAEAVADVYTNGVPEPATLALLGFGALALIRKRK